MWFLKRQRCWIPTTGTSQVLDWELPSPSKEAGGVKDHCRAELLCCNPWPRSEELPGRDVLGRWVPPSSSVMDKVIFPSAGGQVLTVTAFMGCSCGTG